MEIKGIRPYEKNAKKHPKKQIRQLANIIKEVGWRQPVIVNQEGVIVVGHGRYEAYIQHGEELGLSPVWIINDVGKTLSGEPSNIPLTPEQEKTYRLADNKLNESDWDMKLVLPELQSLSLPMVSLTGFNADLILNPEDKDDEVPGVPEEPKSKIGDIYQLGNHRVVCGDSIKKDDIEKLMDGQKADMVFTDPPYNIAYEGGSKKRETIENDNITDFYQFMMNAYASMSECVKAGASCYICHADTERVNFTKAFIDSGYKLSSVIIWAKNNSTFGRQDYFWKHEPILYGWKEGAAHSWYGDNKQDTIWNIDRPSRSDTHPVMKPIELIMKALTNSSKSEDIILDLFLGSGSTLIACEKSKRICYGMELDPKYVDVIVTRYCKFVGSNKIIRNGEQEQW